MRYVSPSLALLAAPEMRVAVPPAEVTDDPTRTVAERHTCLIGALLLMDPAESANTVLAAARRAE